MSFNAPQLRDCIIQPVLDDFKLNSESAQNLLLGTCAQESAFGTYLHQMEGGPALGIYQMEPTTHADIIKNYIVYHPEIDTKLALNFGPIQHIYPQRLIGDLWYATIFARLHYYRVSEPLPDANDIEGLAHYWKNHYNTKAGKGTPEEFIENYKRYVNF